MLPLQLAGGKVAIGQPLTFQKTQGKKKKNHLDFVKSYFIEIC